MPSACVETYKAPRGETRYRVKFILGGRGSRPHHGGSFHRKGDAGLRRAWIVSEFAAMRVPDLRLLEPEPRPAGRTLEDVARDWQASRIDGTEGTGKTYATNLNRILPLLGTTGCRDHDRGSAGTHQRAPRAGEGLDREELVGNRSAKVLADSYTHVLMDERELDYEALIAERLGDREAVLA